MNYIGDYSAGSTVIIYFNTFDSNDPSASVTITNFVNTDVHIHKGSSLTQRNNSAGITVDVDVDGITGTHFIEIDTADNTVADFYTAGSDFNVRIEGTTVDGATINAVVGSFSIENRHVAGVMVKTTIATLASQTSFTLTAGSADDDAYNNCTIIVSDIASAIQKCVGLISDYTGSTRTVTLAEDPGIFTMAASDQVSIIATSALANVRTINATLQTAGDVTADSAAILTDTGTTLDGRIPSALVSGRMDSVLGDTAHGGTSAVITAERIIVASTTATEPAIKLTGNTTGAGILATGGTSSGHGINGVGGSGNGDGFRVAGLGAGVGMQAIGGATGHGITGVGGATSGDGMNLSATSGDGLDARGGTGGSGMRLVGDAGGAGISSTGGATGSGISAGGGATSGQGIFAQAQLNDHAVRLVANGTGEGISIQGGATGHGIQASGGVTSGDGMNLSATSGDGLQATGGTAGHGINADGAGAGEGISATGGATGHGIEAIGGATSGHGVVATAPADGQGISSTGALTGAGILGQGGATGAGIRGVGGGTSGDAISTSVTSGNELDTGVQAEIADAIWNEARSGHATLGSYGDSFIGLQTGSAEAGTLSTTQMTSDLTEATDDHFNGRTIVWTSGVLAQQASDITDYSGATGLLTFTAVTEAASAGDDFVIF